MIDFEADKKEGAINCTVINHEQFCMEKIPAPCGIVIFGASGDLSHRKLLPGLFHLFKTRLLPKEFFILGYARSTWTDVLFREKVSSGLKARGETDGSVRDFLEHVYYRSGTYGDPAAFQALEASLKELGNKHGTKEKLLFHIATPPDVYQVVVTSLMRSGILQKGFRTSNVVIEKPFGHDLSSAQQLNSLLHEALTEEQIFRIDHYLGKETVQNIMMFRFANSIFEPIWNRNNIDHIQITAAETLGVEHRAGYYERSGNLRDMFQNHMFQLLAMVAMEPPLVFDEHHYREEKVKVVKSI